MCDLLWLRIAGVDELKLKSVTESKGYLFNLTYLIFNLTYLILISISHAI